MSRQVIFLIITAIMGTFVVVFAFVLFKLTTFKTDAQTGYFKYSPNLSMQVVRGEAVQVLWNDSLIGQVASVAKFNRELIFKVKATKPNTYFGVTTPEAEMNHFDLSKKIPREGSVSFLVQGDNIIFDDQNDNSRLVKKITDIESSWKGSKTSDLVW